MNAGTGWIGTAGIGFVNTGQDLSTERKRQNLIATQEYNNLYCYNVVLW